MEKRPQYLIRRKGRLGQTVFYVWRRPGKQIRLRETYGTRAFWNEYRAALFGEKPPEKPADAPETLAAMIAAYRRSPAWTRLAKATRNTRGNMLDRIVSKAGDKPLAEVDRKTIVAARDSMNGPGAGKCLIDTLRGFFKWAVEQGYAEENPAAEVARPDTKTDGYVAWSEADIAAYEKRWKVGTRERLWLHILLQTGGRKGDAVKLGPNNIHDGLVEFCTGKTRTPVSIPLHRELKRLLGASPLGKKSFVGLSYDRFGKEFRKACDAAGVTGSAHGLRKAAATRLGQAGASVLELNAVFGWTGAKMALKYTAAADRAKLARQGMERINPVTTSEM